MARKRERRKDEMHSAIANARDLVHDLIQQDGNEAETRRRVERIFEQVMGYDAFRHLTREHAIPGTGVTEYVDFAIQLEDESGSACPVILVELKRIGVDVSSKHIRQASTYAINAGCEWVLLTNARTWQLYHISFGKPPETRLVHAWDILDDDMDKLVRRFGLISHKGVKSGRLAKLWEKRKVLDANTLIPAIFSHACLKTLRRELRRETGVLLPGEDLCGRTGRLHRSPYRVHRPDLRRSARLPAQTHRRGDRPAGLSQPRSGTGAAPLPIDRHASER